MLLYFVLNFDLLLFCFVSFLVAGDPLKGVLNSGFLSKMEKAMLLLVQISAAGAVDQERRGSSRANNSVSIEMLDDQGEKIVEDSRKKVWKLLRDWFLVRGLVLTTLGRRVRLLIGMSRELEVVELIGP